MAGRGSVLDFCGDGVEHLGDAWWPRHAAAHVNLGASAKGSATASDVLACAFGKEAAWVNGLRLILHGQGGPVWAEFGSERLLLAGGGPEGDGVQGCGSGSRKPV